ncbi:MAG: hypothetical protein HN413_06605 [Chloroflexi bacterium]|nr:hypothetical protein [Chloroflexota bacterium]
MIIEYHRPETIEAALALLARKEPRTVPLGGGSVLNQPSDIPVAVVDVQSLGLNQIAARGNKLEIGAAATLQALLDTPEAPLALKDAIRHEAAYNLRNMATVAGAIVAADGRSPFAAAMLALGAELVFANERTLALGEFLPLRANASASELISKISIPLNIKLSYQYVARTPADLPIVCAAAAQWSSGRTRLVLGGFGNSPLLALDGPNALGAPIAARDAYREAGDQWAGAAYRSDVAETLARRAIQAFGASEKKEQN